METNNNISEIDAGLACPRRASIRVKGRKRKAHARRDKNGKSQPIREKRDISARIKVLLEAGMSADHAPDPLSGTVLGRMLLRGCEAATGISSVQYEAGEQYARLCRQYAEMMGFELRPEAASPTFERVSRGSSAHEYPPERVTEVRNEFSRTEASWECPRVRSVCWTACVADREIAILDYGELRVGLNKLARVYKLSGRRALPLMAWAQPMEPGGVP